MFEKYPDMRFVTYESPITDSSGAILEDAPENYDNFHYGNYMEDNYGNYMEDNYKNYIENDNKSEALDNNETTLINNNTPNIIYSPEDTTISTQKLPKSKKEFVDKLYQAYSKVINEYNNSHKEKINSSFIKDLIAQDALESNWGNHALGYNLGGIKANKGQPFIVAGTTEYINGKKVKFPQKFRKFDSLEEFVKYKINMLTKGRYAKAGVFKSPDYVHSIKLAGYFTASESSYKKRFNDIKRSF